MGSLLLYLNFKCCIIHIQIFILLFVEIWIWINWWRIIVSELYDPRAYFSYYSLYKQYDLRLAAWPMIIDKHNNFSKNGTFFQEKSHKVTELFFAYYGSSEMLIHHLAHFNLQDNILFFISQQHAVVTTHFFQWQSELKII